MAIKKMKGFLLMAAIVLGTSVGCVEPDPVVDVLPIDQRDLTPSEFALFNLEGKDKIGREVKRMDNHKEGQHYTGIFYSLWIGQHQYQQTGAYNITHLLETPEGRTALYDKNDNDASRMNEFHFWGEPLYGFYNMKDPWVITRQLEQFINAGLDYLCIDATNNVVYIDSINVLLNHLLKFQEQGYKIPKVMFYTNSYSGDTVNKIYYEWYRNEKYDSVWFSPNGKPMIIGITEKNGTASDMTKYPGNAGMIRYISKELQEFFDVKESEWPNGDFNENSIPWMSWEYPQKIHNGSIAVPVAQHSHSRISVSWMDPESSRGYDNITGAVSSDFDSGLSFQQMWDTAHKEENNVSNVLICSYNEWMAIKKLQGNDLIWVDVFNHEFSRDVEMMKGGYDDNFYLQMVQNIRKYKFTDYVRYQKDKFNINIENGVSTLWNNVKTAYQDLAGDALKRDHEGAVKGLRYTDTSNRNDLQLIKVAHNDENVFFYIECVDDITSYNGKDENYMNIFIKTEETDKNFNGFNFLINRNIKNNKGSVEKSLGGYAFEKVGEADISINGNVMQVKIPRALLNTNKYCDLSFKVSDNVTNYQDIMDYYLTGDSAPVGRLMYGY